MEVWGKLVFQSHEVCVAGGWGGGLKAGFFTVYRSSIAVKEKVGNAITRQTRIASPDILGQEKSAAPWWAGSKKKVGLCGCPAGPAPRRNKRNFLSETVKFRWGVYLRERQGKFAFGKGVRFWKV